VTLIVAEVTGSLFGLVTLIVTAISCACDAEKNNREKTLNANRRKRSVEFFFMKQ
jgi:hypothetical protein